MAFVDASYWRESAEHRDETAPLSDTRCFLCRQSLEGQPFIEWEIGSIWGPEQQLVIGMHLDHAYRLSIGILKDLAAHGQLDTSELNDFLSGPTSK